MSATPTRDICAMQIQVPSLSSDRPHRTGIEAVLGDNGRMNDDGTTLGQPRSLIISPAPCKLSLRVPRPKQPPQALGLARLFLFVFVYEDF